MAKDRAPGQPLPDSERAAIVELLQRGDMSQADIARQVEVSPNTVGKIARELREEQPQATRMPPPPGSDDGRREQDHTPTAPAGAPRYTPPDDRLNYTALQDYISSFYRLGAGLAEKSDPALGMAIAEHADKAGAAWVKWIESEPRVALLLQRMMIGTPLGEVIGVHVSLVIGYVLARNAARIVAEQQREAAAGDEGFTEPAQPVAPAAAA